MTNVIIIVIMMRRFAAATHFPCAGAGIDLTLIRAPGSDHWEATSTPGWTYLGRKQQQEQHLTHGKGWNGAPK